MADASAPASEPEKKPFTPKQPVQLDPPKGDPITYEELAECDGMDVPTDPRPS